MAHNETRASHRRTSERRLFLGSDGLAALDTFVRGDPREMTLAFVPTAANPIPDRSFLERDLAYVRDLGFRVEAIDIEAAAARQVHRALRRADALFVEGRSSYYLLEKAREAGFLELLREFVESGRLYIGMSAGALIVGPDIEPMSIVTDTSLGANLTTTQAAGIVNFVVLTDFDQREAAYREVIARYGGRYKLVPLRDDEAVLIEGTAWRVVPSPS